MRRRQQPAKGTVVEDRDISRWSASKLLAFIRQHGVEPPAPPIEKSELVRVAQEIIDNLVLEEACTEGPGRSGAESKTADVLLTDIDPSSASVSEVALHMSQPKYALYFRRHPDALVELINQVHRNHPIRACVFPVVGKWLTDTLNGMDEGATLHRALSTANSAVCGRHLTRNDVCFRCLDCAADPTCILCAECFKTSPCQHHDYRMVRSGGGMCDCGDPTAWKKESFCTHHRGITEDDDPSSKISPEEAAWIFPCLRASLRLMLLLIKTFVDGDSEAATSAPRQKTIDSKHETVISVVAQRLVDLVMMGDCARRVVSRLLCEPIGDLCGDIASDVVASADVVARKSALELIFELDVTPRVCRQSCWPLVRNLVTQCVADPFLKIPVCRQILQHRERAFDVAVSQSDDDRREAALSSLAVQVFTVPTVVDALLNPKRLDLAGESTTIFDRLVSSVLYSLVAFRDKSNDAIPNIEKDGVLRIDPTATEQKAFQIAHLLIELKYCMKASKLAKSFFASSVVLNRAIAVALEYLSYSSWLTRDPDRHGHVLTWNIEGRLSNILNMLLPVWRACAHSLATGRAASAQPDDLTNPLALFLSHKHKCLQPYEGASAQHQISNRLLRLAAVPEGSRSGSFASCSSAINLVKELLRTYGEPAQRFVQLLSTQYTSTNRNVLDPDKDPMTFCLASLRFFSSISRLLLELPGVSLQDLRDVLCASITTGEVSANRTSGDSGQRPLADNITNVQHQAQSTHVSSARWLEVLMWPHVVVAQYGQSLWKRDFMKIGHHVDLYHRLWQSYTLEHDVLLSQFLALTMPVALYTSTVYRQFAYIPADGRLERSAIPFGYGPFLRSILTIALDDSKMGVAHIPSQTNTPAAALQAYLRHHLRLLLSSSPSGFPRSAIQAKMASLMNIDEDDDDDDMHTKQFGIAGSAESIVTAALSEMAVSEQRRDGTWYKLKDAAEFAKINPYSCHLLESKTRDEMWKEFSFALVRCKADATELATLDAFPLHHAVDPSLKLLLHTPTVSNIACFVIMAAVCGGEHDVPAVSVPDLVCAVDALLVTVADSRRLSLEMSKACQVFADSVDWDVVETALGMQLAAIPAVEEGLRDAPLPLPELATAGFSLLRRATATITHMDLSLLKRSSKTMLQKPTSIANCLQTLREWAYAASPLGSETQAKEPSRLFASCPSSTKSLLHHRITLVLRALSLLTDESTQHHSASSEASATTPAPDQNEKALRAKQRQREIMEKMKAKQQKVLTSFTNDSNESKPVSSDTAITSATESRPPSHSDVSSPNGSASCSLALDHVHAKCLVAATELECCFCQCNDDDQEPLCALAHFTTSSVLKELGCRATVSDDIAYGTVAAPWIGAHMHYCGHVAHPRCVHRHHQHIASMRHLTTRQLLMAHRGYRGMAYLGASEFACPMCSRTCSALGFLPHIQRQGDTASTTSSSSSSFFGEMIAAAQRESSYYDDFRQSWMNAAVGLSASTDHRALFDVSAIEAALSAATGDARVLTFVLLHSSADFLRNEVQLLRSGCEFGLPRYAALLSAFVAVASLSRELLLEVRPFVKDPLALYLLTVLRQQQEDSASQRDQSALANAFAAHVKQAVGDLATSPNFNLTSQLVSTFADALNDNTSSVGEPTSAAVLIAAWEVLSHVFLLQIVVESAQLELRANDEVLRCLFSTPGKLRAVTSAFDCASASIEMLKSLCGSRHQSPAVGDLALIELLMSSVSTPPDATVWTLTGPQRALRSVLLPSDVLAHIASEILHLPLRYNQIVLQLAGDTNVCMSCQRKAPPKPVLCLTCNSVLCLQNEQEPELFEHARLCGGGAGLFLIVKATSFLIVQGVSGRATQLPSAYVDRYGERDESMHRGAALSRSPEHTKEFVQMWLRSGWDTDTQALSHSWRHGADRL